MDIQDICQLKQDDIIIACMGPTGAGKSNFIDLLSNEEGKRSGHSLKSETAKIQATRVRHPTTGSDNIVLIDTPGFDDTSRSDVEIIVMISDWLEKLYKKGIKLRGLLYLYPITECRLTGAANNNLRLLRELCGDSAAKCVVLVSTKWQDTRDTEIAQQRERDLQEEFWQPFVEAGSRVERMSQNDDSEAWRIVEELIRGAGDGMTSLFHDKAVELELQRHQKESAPPKDFLHTLLPRTKLSSHSTQNEKLKEMCTRVPDPEVLAKDMRQDDIIIAFMGPAGVGKTHFIDLLFGDRGKRSTHSMKSGTTRVETTRIKHPRTGVDNIILVDTPGFGDAFRTDFEVLTIISDWLAKTYKNGIKLSGLVYLHAITDARMTETTHLNLRTFASICGESAMSRTVIVSTKWEDVKLGPGMEIAERRESELIGEFWKPFIEEGARVKRLDRTSDGEQAWSIVEDLVRTHHDRRSLLLQEEIVDLDHGLNETNAWEMLSAGVQTSLGHLRDYLTWLLLVSDETTGDTQRKRVLEKRHK